MPSILLEDGSYLLNVFGDYFLLESGDATQIESISLSCVELLGINHQCNFWGDAFNYSNSQSLNIRGRVTGSYENVTGVWDGMSGLIAYTTGNRQIYLNSVDVGVGRIASLSFDRGTDVGFKTYSATIEIPRHAGTGLFSNTGYVPTTGTDYSGYGETIQDLFNSSTGKYIKSFSLDETTDIIASGKYSKNKSVNFALDGGINDEFGVSPNVYAAAVMAAAQNSFGNVNIVTAFYPDYYQNSNGISQTSRNYDTINYNYSFSESFLFQTGLPYIWNHSHSLSLGESVVSVEENGTIQSSDYSGSMIGAAAAAWTVIESGIYNRVSGVYSAYTGVIGYSGGCQLFNYPEKSSLKRDSFGGSIQYSKTYSNSPFTSTGYFNSYSDEISIDEDGYVTVKENGQLKAFRNIRPSGFNLVLDGYRAQSGAIVARLNNFYTGTTGVLRSCYVSGGLHLNNSEETYKEYDAEIAYEISYSDNPGTISNGLFYRATTQYSDVKPTHITNYFPINYGSIISQPTQQSTRGIFTNSITLMGREATTLNDFITGARAYLQKPSGTDILANGYSYEYNPLDNNFSMELSYGYNQHRTSTQYLV